MPHVIGTFWIPGCRFFGPEMMDPMGSLWEQMFWLAADTPVTGLKQTKEKPTLPNTTGFTEEQIYDLYARYVDLHGSADAKKALTDGKQVIVALRIETDTRAKQGKGIYDDRMALIWQEKGGKNDGKKHGKEFAANTEPSAQYEQREEKEVEVVVKSKKTGKYVKVKVKKKVDLYDAEGKKVKFSKVDGQDINADKRKDPGRLAAGTYKMQNAGAETFLGAKYLKSSNDQVAQRDVNHDGRFTSADTWSKDGADQSTHSGNFAMYIHRGGKDNTWSAGCQTLPPTDHSSFFKTIHKKQTEYYYVLVNLE